MQVERNEKLIKLEERDVKKLSIKELFDIFYTYNTKIIYIQDNGVLSGIITLGAMLDRIKKQDVSNIIRKDFCVFKEKDFDSILCIANIMEEKNITTAVPICDEYGRLIYEVRNCSDDETNELNKLQEEFLRYKNSHYLKRECDYLKKILNEQNIIILGNEEQLHYYMGDLFENVVGVQFLEELENPYLFLEGREDVFIDLQAAKDSARELIYRYCNNGYSWRTFWKEILSGVYKEMFSKRYEVISNGYYEDIICEYREGSMEVWTNSILYNYIRNNCSKIRDRFVLKRELIRRNEIQMTVLMYGKTLARMNHNEFDSIMNNAYLDTQIQHIYKRYKDQMLVFYINEREGVYLSEREKERLYLPRCEAREIESLTNLYPVNNEKDYFRKILDEATPGYVRNVENSLLLFNEQKSTLVNCENGIRKTCNQPDEYIGTIYVYGLCTVYGNYLEDKYTIPSLIQDKLNENHIPYRVVNIGNLLPINLEQFLDSIEFKENDILVCLACFTTKQFLKSVTAKDISKDFEKRKRKFKDRDCFVDALSHPGTYGSMIYATIMYEDIKKHIKESVTKEYKNGIYHLFRRDMTDMEILYGFDSYIQEIHGYDRYIPKSAKKIGCIVMNCNPFTKGHRYLIEYASKKVDFLYVFVVEEDKSYFSFKDRLEMVRLGTSDLKNVVVVRSGKMILSNVTFSAYFTKETKSDYQTRIPPSVDLRVFAQYIAEEFRITTRFVGEEPRDIVTKQYNEYMKEIFPQFGIELIEIPRVEDTDGEVISASRVRKHYMENDFETIEKLVPKTTADYLQQLKKV